MKDVGIYVHIPFCIKKCFYCDFISYENKNELKHEYVKYLLREIEHVGIGNKEDYKNDLDDLVRVRTIYFGGGTPSYIDSKAIIDILDTIKRNFSLIENCEITLEINPGTVDEQKLQDYYNSGINRISIGLQETNDYLLSLIGRVHNFQQFLETYKLARKIGFDNINVDLISALPNQTIDDVKKTLDTIIELNPEHVSVYSLILEDETKLAKMVEEKILNKPDEKLEREMYWLIKDKLEKNGYNHYEISNYSKIGYESKHNLDCWNQNEYIGFGVSAHSYTNSVRFSNIESIEEYIINIRNCEEYKNLIFHEKQDQDSKMKEYMMLGLRKIKGININEFKEKFLQNPVFIFKKELNKLVNEGLIEVDEEFIRLTKNGIDFANIVWQDFI
ncbi:MAG TPA: radical SAM family heme chaperone HemW [Clostridia bacterium]|nr:radical SAM family heme chaperone HemW [Clostridia bacterium]